MCVNDLCGSDLYVSESDVCVSDLYVSDVCVNDLYVSDVCVSDLYVCDVCHQFQPSAVSATPATQSASACHQVPRLPRKE